MYITKIYTRIIWMIMYFFYKQKTAYEMRISDWSSDVCSSDLQPGDPRDLAEHVDLRQRILAGGGVEHQHDIVRRRRVQAAEDALDLGQLVHQLAPVLKPAGSVDDQHVDAGGGRLFDGRSEEHTSELQSLMRISYAVFCLKKKTK